jgi:hypothetical protein
MSAATNSSGNIAHRTLLIFGGQQQVVKPVVSKQCAIDKASKPVGPRYESAAMALSDSISKPSSAAAFVLQCKTVTWWRNSPRPEAVALVEKGKSVSSASEWQSRAEMFNNAMGSGAASEPFNGIFSISIEPTNSNLSQPLYYRHSYVHVGQANLKADPLLGFLKPYKTFFCQQFTADIDPQTPPAHVQQCLVKRVEDITSAVKDIEPFGVRKKVRSIVSAFLLDPHAKKMYLITVQPFYTPANPVKYKLFIKT